jgi:hypothetical protein
MLRPFSALTAALVALGALACGGTSSSTMAGPSPAKCQLSATNNTPSFGATGGQGSIVIAAERECAWSAAAQVSWVALAPPAQGQGDSTLKYSVQANPSSQPRRGSVNVSGTLVDVGQEAAPCRFDLDRTKAQIGSDATSLDVNVQGPTGCAWTAVSQADWIAVAEGSQGSGPGRVTLRASANTGALRIGTVLIAGVRFELTQASPNGPPPPPPPGCSYTLLPGSTQLPAVAAAGNVSLTTDSACPWTAVSDQPWLSITSSTSGTGSAQIAYSVTANDTSATRTGSITVGNAVFTVQQAAAGSPTCSYVVNPASPITSDAGGTSGSLAVNTTGRCEWTAAASESWIRVSPAQGTGSGQVSYTIAPNAATTSRTGSITIAGTTVSVTQSGVAGPPLTISGAVANLSGSCPSVTFSIEAFTAVTSPSTGYKSGSCGKLKDGDVIVVRGVLTVQGIIDVAEIEFTK